MKIVATTSLPAVDRPNADRWNAARSRQLAESFHILVNLMPSLVRPNKPEVRKIFGNHSLVSDH